MGNYCGCNKDPQSAAEAQEFDLDSVWLSIADVKPVIKVEPQCVCLNESEMESWGQQFSLGLTNKSKMGQTYSSEDPSSIINPFDLPTEEMDEIQQCIGTVHYKNYIEQRKSGGKYSPIKTVSDSDTTLIDIGQLPSAEREKRCSPHELHSPKSLQTSQIPNNFAFTPEPNQLRYKSPLSIPSPTSLQTSQGPTNFEMTPEPKQVRSKRPLSIPTSMTRISNRSTIASSQVSLFKSHLKSIKSPTEILHQGGVLVQKKGITTLWLDRWCTLTGQSLRFYKNFWNAEYKTNRPLSTIPINQISHMESKSRPLRENGKEFWELKLRTATSWHVFRIDQKDEYNRWVSALNFARE